MLQIIWFAVIRSDGRHVSQTERTIDVYHRLCLDEIFFK
jgi:hypothetical protein